VSRLDDGPLVVVDLSNLCRDQRVLAPGVKADDTLLDRFTDALDASGIPFGRLHCVADRSLPPLLGPSGKRRLREMEQAGSLEYSAIADERLLELAFGASAATDTLVASLDGFDDYRRTYPSIQGSTDRFIGWEPGPAHTLRVVRRDMGVHAHHVLSRKEESAELKARRLRRQSVVRRAAETYFRCDNERCLLAQLWPDRLPELPRFDDQSELFVCPSCEGPLTIGETRPASTQLIVFLHGTEQFRLLLDEGQRVEIGRRDAKGCIGIESRLGPDATSAISRRHLAFTRTDGHVAVEDLGSRNGTVLRWIDGSHPDERLHAGVPQVIGRRSTVALPAGITIEVSGRTVPLDGERAPETGTSGADDRATRILATRR
jgi:hypothetical protein